MTSQEEAIRKEIALTVSEQVSAYGNVALMLVIPYFRGYTDTRGRALFLTCRTCSPPPFTFNGFLLYENYVS